MNKNMYIELGDGTYALSATPDPRKILTAEELENEKKDKEKEILRCDNEIANIKERKTKLEEEIAEINNL